MFWFFLQANYTLFFIFYVYRLIKKNFSIIFHQQWRNYYVVSINKYPLFFIWWKVGAIILLSKNDLINLSNLSIDDVDKNTLKELTNIKRCSSDSVEKSFTSFLEQIGNPYHFLINSTQVQISFASSDKKLHDCLLDYFIHRKNQET